MKKIKNISLSLFITNLIIISAFMLFLSCGNKSEVYGNERNIDENSLGKQTNTLNIPRIELDSDYDNDGIKDLDDIIEGARKDAKNKPRYKSAYYSGGYPPDDEGVCTDTIWRALDNAGYNLKKMLDKDIKDNIKDYPRVNGKPDPNIDFRRVLNLIPFFKKYATNLTIKVKLGNVKNLTEWQGGDIVVYGKPVNHIAIISDIRRKDGVPYIIHNGSPYTKEEDALLYWHNNVSPIIHHFRFPNLDKLDDLPDID
jgi:uncharacterized protein